MNCLNDFFKKIQDTKVKICVVGDSLIDEYYSVKVNRVSPEFPIPVLLSEIEEPISVVPGGAANVCYQMKHWNTDVYLISVLSTHGEQIINSHNYNCEYSVVMNNGWKMPKKKRFYDGDFPLDRWDVETKDLSKLNTTEWSEARKLLLIKFKEMVNTINPDIVILSDYGKGVFVKGKENISQEIINFCNNKSIPVIVDPKTTNSNFWKNCTILKPNADWAKNFLDKHYPDYDCSNNWKSEIPLIQFEINCKEVVLTDSGNGVGIFDGKQFNYFNSPTLSKKRPIIRSVIGAGDCFCSFFAMAKSLNFNTEECVLIAFNGANAYIEDKHNNPVTPYQFKKWYDPLGAKIVSLEELINIKNQMPKQTWVWTNGCFDIVHIGHLKTFEEAKKLGDKVVVGLNTDESIKLIKGSERPILPYNQREKMISHLHYVDFVVPVYDKTPGTIIKKIMPDKIVKGGDYKVNEIDGHEIVGNENVHLVDLEPNISTSQIIKKAKDGK